MRPTRPDGFSLVEMIIAIVLTGILGAAVLYFLYPVRQAIDITVRADLTESADAALQRIARDVRLALPNSVRVTSDLSGAQYLEFLAIRAAGRYRSDVGSILGGTDCNPGVAADDQLSFDSADACFKTIGKESTLTSVVNGDLLILNNYGAGFTGQNAYETGATNRTTVSSVDTSESGRDRIVFASKTFQRTVHDSPGKRFFISSGPVTYKCDPIAKALTRHSGYGIAASESPTGATQPTSVGAGNLVADKVSSCAFDYSANVAPQVGLLTLRLQLSEKVSSGVQETVSLYHSVHVSNVP
jgi:MSHA biogenesis protein MshO